MGPCATAVKLPSLITFLGVMRSLCLITASPRKSYFSRLIASQPVKDALLLMLGRSILKRMCAATIGHPT